MTTPILRLCMQFRDRVLCDYWSAPVRAGSGDPTLFRVLTVQGIIPHSCIALQEYSTLRKCSNLAVCGSDCEHAGMMYQQSQ